MDSMYKMKASSSMGGRENLLFHDNLFMIDFHSFGSVQPLHCDDAR